MKIGVLALGNWGTAFAHHLAELGHDVIGWSADETIVSTINKTHKNPRALSDISLHRNITATSNLAEACANSVVILAFPAAALKELAGKLKGLISKESIVVSLIKGFEDDSLLTPLEKIQSVLGSIPCVVVSGPSFAKDVIEGKPASVVVASVQEEIAKKIADLFSGRSFKLYLSTDPKGVELGGAVKNVMALAVGVADGLSLGDSARAGLITRGLAEMVRFATTLGAQKETLFGLSGLGDLVMTATSDQSRNRRAGLRLGKGEKLKDILSSMGSVVEGVHTAPLLFEKGKHLGIELPITEQMTKVIRGEITPSDAVKALISRPMKREF